MLQKSVKQEGSSLIEIAIVSFLIVTVLTALVSLTTMTIARNRLSKERTVATRLAQEAVEWFRFERDRLGFAPMDLVVSMPSHDNVKFCMQTIPVSPDAGLSSYTFSPCSSVQLIDSKYTRNAVLTTDGSTISYTVTVSWPKAGGQDEIITLTGVLNQWQ